MMRTITYLTLTAAISASLAACAPAVQKRPVTGKPYERCTEKAGPGVIYKSCKTYSPEGFVTLSEAAYDARTKKLIFAIDQVPGSPKMVTTEMTSEGIVQSVDENGDGQPEIRIRHNPDGSIDDLLGSRRYNLGDVAGAREHERKDAADEPGVSRFKEK